jgi:hypothetical protein
MKLGKPGKIALLVFTLWPIIYMFVFFAFVFTTFFRDFASKGAPEGPEGFLIIFGLHFFTMIFMIALTIFYIVYLFKTDKVRQDKKALWAVVIFLGNMIAMPVFWYLYVWKEPEPIDYDEINKWAQRDEGM